MSEVQPYKSALLLGDIGRQAERKLQRMYARSAMERELLKRLAELEADTSDAITYVGLRALHNTAILSQTEQNLGQAVPHASGRLDLIASVTSLALADHAQQAFQRLIRS
jgi:hypothetical protein